MTDDLRAKWADRIAALLRKAESTDSADEAETFFAKAQELMSKYAIDEAMLAASNPEARRSDPVEWDEFVTVGIYRHALYMLDYYVLLVNGCKAIEIPGSPWRTIDSKTYKETRIIRAVGLKSDIEKARIMATSLKLQCMRAENTWWKEHQELYRSMPKGKQHQARRGFMLAFASAAFTKMKEAQARGQKSAEAEHGKDSVALVLRDKSLMVSDEFNRVYPQTRGKTSRLSAGDAFARSHGHAAGQRADIGQPTVGGNRKQLK
jgi:hypothetical protein